MRLTKKKKEAASIGYDASTLAAPYIRGLRKEYYICVSPATPKARPQAKNQGLLVSNQQANETQATGRCLIRQRDYALVVIRDWLNGQ